MNTQTKEPQNLMDGLLREINRVREIIKEYEMPELKGAGIFAATMMKQSIAKAENSIRSNDVIEMLRAYSELKEYENWIRMSAEDLQLLSDYNKTLEDLFEARQKIKELEKEIERLKEEKVEDNPDYTYLRIY